MNRWEHDGMGRPIPSEVYGLLLDRLRYQTRISAVKESRSEALQALLERSTPLRLSAYNDFTRALYFYRIALDTVCVRLDGLYKFWHSLPPVVPTLAECANEAEYAAMVNEYEEREAYRQQLYEIQAELAVPQHLVW